MKTKFDLFKAANALAESLIGETSQKKIHDTASAKFDELKLTHENDWNVFINYVHEAKNKFEALEKMTLDTVKEAEAKAKAAE